MTVRFGGLLALFGVQSSLIAEDSLGLMRDTTGL